jgi:multidrug efflux system membrane fusion protein
MKRVRFVLLILPLLLCAAATGCRDGAGGREQQKAPTVLYELPTKKTITDHVPFPGTTQAIVAVQVTSRVSGYMTEVLFKDGDLAKANDVLFRIDNRQYKAELERAEGNLQQLEIHRTRQGNEYQRAQILLDRGQISREEYDRYQSDLHETEAGVKLARSNRDLAQLNYDWCEVRASASGRLSRRMVDPGNLIKADDTVLTSIVSEDPIYVYLFVNEQTQAAPMIQRLLEEGKLRASSLREVPVQIGLSDEGDDEFPHSGVVDFTNNREENGTRNLQFRAKLDNKDHFLIPGLVVRVRLPVGDPHPAIFIREKALVNDQGEKGVYLIRERDEKGQPFPNDVDLKGNPFFNDTKPLVQRAFWSKVGNPPKAVDQLVEIEHGVKADDWVVITDMQRLKNGRNVIGERFTRHKPDQLDSKPGVADSYVTYDLPITQTVNEFERIEGETDAIYTVQVTPRVSGYMTKVNFKDGDLVSAGDLLFEIDSRPFKAELDRAEGNLQQLLAHGVRLDSENRRAQHLSERGSISSEERGRYDFDWKENEAGVRLAKANRDLAQLNVDWCEVRASTTGRLSRRMVDPGNLVKADETALTSIVSLDPIYVYFDVHEQAMLRIKHLLQQGKLKARSLREIPVEIRLAEQADDTKPRVGIVDFTDNKVGTNGTLSFRAKLDNKDHSLTPGLFVRVRLPVGDPHPAVMVRERALVTIKKQDADDPLASDRKEKGVFVLVDRDLKGNPLADVKDKSGKPVAVRRAVWTPVGTPGVLRDGYQEVEKGVRPGDWIVVGGMQRLKDGKLVMAEKFETR